MSELLDKISELETLNTVNSAEATNNRATLTDEDGAERKENEKLQIQIRELGSVISNMLDDLNQQEAGMQFDDAQSYVTNTTNQTTRTTREALQMLIEQSEANRRESLSDKEQADETI